VIPELSQCIQWKDAGNLKQMTASRKQDLKSHERKLKLGQVLKLKLPVGE
jgi:hypothetical protein